MVWWIEIETGVAKKDYADWKSWRGKIGRKEWERYGDSSSAESRRGRVKGECGVLNAPIHAPGI